MSGRTSHFYEDRAEVRRRGQATVEAGVQRIQVGGLTPLLVDRSLRIEVRWAGQNLPLGSQVVRRDWKEPAQSQAALTQEVLEAMLTVQDLEHRESSRQARCQHLDRAFGDWLKGLRETPLDQVTEWRRAFPRLKEALLTARRGLQEATQEVRAARLHQTELEQKLEAAGRQRRPLECLVEFEIDSPGGGTAEIIVTYHAPCALWRPEYLTEVHQGRLRLAMYAVLWQSTGEDWSQVECRVATGRPSPHDHPPELEVCKVGLKTRDPEARIAVETHQVASKPGTAGAPRTGVLNYALEDHGKALTMTGHSKITMPSQPGPTRVLLARTELDCQIEGFAFPELSQGVHRRVQALHDGFGQGWPLLAGPVRFEGTGRTRVGYCAPGDRFQFSLGLEEGLAVERQQSSQDDVVPITGTQRWTTKTEVSVHNLTDQTRRVMVRERIPVSQISDINVKLLRAPKEHSYDAETGFVDCPLELGPYQSAWLVLVQRVKASPRVEFAT